MNSEKQITYPVYLTWETVQPDRRQWKPSLPTLRINTLVQVDVPLTDEYFANSQDMIVNQLSAGSHVEGILTPKGMRYVIDQLELVMSDPEVTKEDFQPTASEDVEWEDKETETTETTENKDTPPWKDETETTETTTNNDVLETLEWEN